MVEQLAINSLNDMSSSWNDEYVDINIKSLSYTLDSMSMNSREDHIKGSSTIRSKSLPRGNLDPASLLGTGLNQSIYGSLYNVNHNQIDQKNSWKMMTKGNIGIKFSPQIYSENKQNSNNMRMKNQQGSLVGGIGYDLRFVEDSFAKSRKQSLTEPNINHSFVSKKNNSTPQAFEHLENNGILNSFYPTKKQKSTFYNSFNPNQANNINQFDQTSPNIQINGTPQNRTLESYDNSQQQFLIKVRRKSKGNSNGGTAVTLSKKQQRYLSPIEKEIIKQNHFQTINQSSQDQVLFMLAPLHPQIKENPSVSPSDRNNEQRKTSRDEFNNKINYRVESNFEVQADLYRRIKEQRKFKQIEESNQPQIQNPLQKLMAKLSENRMGESNLLQKDRILFPSEQNRISEQIQEFPKRKGSYAGSLLNNQIKKNNEKKNYQIKYQRSYSNAWNSRKNSRTINDITTQAYEIGNKLSFPNTQITDHLQQEDKPENYSFCLFGEKDFLKNKIKLDKQIIPEKNMIQLLEQLQNKEQIKNKNTEDNYFKQNSQKKQKEAGFYIYGQEMNQIDNQSGDRIQSLCFPQVEKVRNNLSQEKINSFHKGHHFREVNEEKEKNSETKKSKIQIQHNQSNQETIYLI